MDSWPAPSGTPASDKFLYDNEGNRVLQRTSTTVGSTTTVTDDITFGGMTEVTISGGTTATSKYYSANGQRVAMRVNGILSYLLSDMLGSSTVALNSDGSGQAVQLFAPYGSVRYSGGTMPTTYNFTGQRLDSQTGLLYYNSRYYDPVSGRFVQADMVESNAGGMDPFAYVGDNPESMNDPSGHDENPIWNVIRIVVITVVTTTVTPIAVVAGLGVALLAGSSILIANAPSAHYGSDYPTNGPQPTPAPTPTETQTPTPTPSTDTNGGMCKTGGCYDLGKAEGYTYTLDRKSTRLNSSHQIISYAVFCLKKKIDYLVVCRESMFRLSLVILEY